MTGKDFFCSSAQNLCRHDQALCTDSQVVAAGVLRSKKIVMAIIMARPFTDEEGERAQWRNRRHRDYAHIFGPDLIWAAAHSSSYAGAGAPRKSRISGPARRRPRALAPAVLFQTDAQGY